MIGDLYSHVSPFDLVHGPFCDKQIVPVATDTAMPKTNNPLTRSKTSPGVSYTIPDAKLVAVNWNPDYDLFAFTVELDPLEEALLARAAREVMNLTFPGSMAELRLPILMRRGKRVIYADGRFPPSIRGVDGKPLETIKAGAIVQMRVMLKAWRAPDAVVIAAFPSAIDVQASAAPAKRTTKAKADKATPTPGPASPKPKTAKATKPTTTFPFDKAAFARHRAEVVKARARLTAKDKTVAETAPALPSNVIPFPVKFRARSK